MSSVHHYVPQFYLKYFTTDIKKPKVWAYQRNKPPFQPHVKNIAGETDFYKFVDSRTGEPSNEIEQVFSTSETLAKGILDALNKPGKIKLSHEDHGNLMYFIGSLYTRGMSHRLKQANMMNAMSKKLVQVKAMHKESFIDDLKKTGNFTTEEKAEELRQYALKGEYDLKSNPRDSYFLKLSLETMQEAYLALVGKDAYLVINKTDRELITSDGPVSIHMAKNLPAHMSGGLMNGIIILPVAPNKCIVLKNKGSKAPGKYLNGSLLEEINGRTMFNAYRYVFSKTKSDEVEEVFNRTEAGFGQAVETSGPFGRDVFNQIN
jgi:hypothetical protein